MKHEYTCPHCHKPIYDDNALLCLFCGESLERTVGFLGTMRTKVVFAVLAILAFCSLIFLAGCASSHVRMYEGERLSPNEIVTVKTDSPRVKIAYVDGKKTTGRISYILWGKWPQQVTIAAGAHEIIPCYETPFNVFYGTTIRLEAQAGSCYILRHKIHRKDPAAKESVYFWIEAEETGPEKALAEE